MDKSRLLFGIFLRLHSVEFKFYYSDGFLNCKDDVFSIYLIDKYVAFDHTHAKADSVLTLTVFSSPI